MSQEKKEYMLLFRDTSWHKELSPEQMQQVAAKWMAWFEGLSKQGIAASGRPLAPEGKLVSGKAGRTVADGPFAESKEAIGGYFLVLVNSEEEAVAIAQQCPGLPYGVVVEVRPAMATCQAMEKGQTELASAHA